MIDNQLDFTLEISSPGLYCDTDVCREMEIEKVRNVQKQEVKTTVRTRTRLTARERILQEKQKQATTPEKTITKPQKTVQNKVVQREKVRQESLKSKGLLELENVVRLVTLERQQLEKQLSLAAEALQKQTAKELGRQASVDNLRHRIGELDRQLANHRELASRLRCAESEVKNLSGKLNDKAGYCDELESQLTRVLSKNNELSAKNNDLAYRVDGFRNVDSDLSSLRRLLSSGSNGNFSDVGSLVGKVDRLEAVLAAMREAAERRREIEQQHADAVRELQRRQAEASTKGPSYNSEGLDSLQSQIRELEKKAELQTVRHEELLLEMATLRKPGEKSSSGPPSMLYTTANFSSLSSSGTSQGMSSLTNYPGAQSLGTSYSGTSGLGTSLPGSQGSMGYANMASQRWLDLDSRTATPDSFRLPSNDSTTSLNLDSLLEMERLAGTRNSSSDWPTQLGSRSRDLENERILAQLDKARGGMQGIPSILSDNVTGLRSTTTQVSTTPSYSLPGSLPTTSYMSLSENLMRQPSTSATNLYSLPGYGAQNLGFPGPSLTSHSGVMHSNFLPNLPASGIIGAGGFSHFGGMGLHQPITTSFERDKTPLMNGPLHGLPSMEKHSSGDGKVDMLDIPGKGRCYVYLARYSYDPFQQSPNERPEAELSVNAGDYILVWGGMDEDGFLDGELLDGRRGLVPSNFVQRLVGEDLLEFHRSVVLRLRDADDSVTTTVPRDVQFPTEPLPPQSHMNPIPAASSAQYATDLALVQFNDFLGEEELALNGTGEPPVPPPRQLTLERQLNKSILIGWNPSEAANGTIEMYHVYVDGILKTTVKATERTRALIDGVDSNRPHRISVRSVTPRRRASLDAACTMVIGKGAPVAPTCVKVSQITATSACITWLPSNSNYQHTVCVNNVEVRTVKPGVYRHTISGLAPNTLYRVTIKAKAIRAPYFDDKPQNNQIQQNVVEKYSTSVEFKTLSKVLPDPPVDVQVEPGPQNGTLLVTWLPVTIKSTSGTSNGVPVTGYAVYADGKKVTDVDTPTGDHALIDLACLEGLDARHLTVRTKSRDGQSPDSNPTQIPQDILSKKKQQIQEPQRSLLQSLLPASLRSSPKPTAAQPLAGGSSPARLLPPPGQSADVGSTCALLAPPTTSIAPPISPAEVNEEPERVDLWLYQPHDFGSEPRSLDLSDIAEEDEESGSSIGDEKTIDLDRISILDNRLRDELCSVSPLGATEVSADFSNGPQQQQQQYDHQPRLRQQQSFHDDYGERDQSNQIPAIEITGDSASESHRPYDNPTRGRAAPVGQRQDPTAQMRPQDPRRRGFNPASGQGPSRANQRQKPVEVNSYSTRGRGRGGQYGGDQRQGRYGEGRPRTEQTRIFVALFDYDPPSMSPNPDACEDELPFREGQLIKVFGDKDADGFFYGECGGRNGYVPCNMISEVQVEDERIAHDLMKDHQDPPERRGRRTSPRGGQAGGRGDRWGDIYQNMPVKKMVALYDYDPQELSPNVDADVELSFQAGDTIYVYGEMDDDGFFMGELRGQRGLVPSNFLSEAAPEQERRREHLNPQEARSQRGVSNDPRSRQREESRDRRVKAAGLEPRTLSQEDPPRAPVKRDGSRPRYLQEDSISETEEYSRPSKQLPKPEELKLPNGNAHPLPQDPPVAPPPEQKPSFLRGLPKVLPDISFGESKPAPPSNGEDPPPILPTAGANLMARFSEMTQSNPGEGLLSKGKELIFKKFGL